LSFGVVDVEFGGAVKLVRGDILEFQATAAANYFLIRQLFQSVNLHCHFIWMPLERCFKGILTDAKNFDPSTVRENIPYNENK